MDRLELPKPKRLKTGRKRIFLAAGFVSLAIGAAAIFAAVKLRVDPEVMDDIDSHFERMDRYEPASGAYSGSAEEYGDEQMRDGLPAQGGRSVSDSAERAASRGRRGRRPRGDAPTPETPSTPGSSEEESRWEGISCVAPGTCTIDSALFARARENPRGFTGGARAVVAKVNGESVGFRIGGLRGDSAIRALGLRNGDVVTAVNGHPLKSADEALAAAASMSFQNKFRVDIIRKGKRRSLYYRVQ